jgi:thiamine pyrophosphate-dependent acetolactate synthase large subunit-like protein
VKVHEAIAQALTAEGVTALFGLMGDGNIDVLASIREQGAIASYEARHEGSALAMADGYARASGDVGLCYVTHGPGLTQLATSLAVASRHGTPIVVLAGDLAAVDKGIDNHQDIDQRPIVEACGALFQPLRAATTVAEDVEQAFWLARSRRLPVVLNCPVDIQNAEIASVEYRPSRMRLGPVPALPPDPRALAEALDLLTQARTPVVVAGRGAIAAGALDALQLLAERIGAALATSVRAKGALDGPWSVGVCGGQASTRGEAVFAAADLVILVGARADTLAAGAGKLYPQARTLQIDTNPGATVARQPADCLLVGDARIACERLLDRLVERNAGGRGFRGGDWSEIFSADPLEQDIADAPFAIADGALDPRRVAGELDRRIAADATILVGVGHNWSAPTMYLNGNRTRRFIFAFDFGCIGQTIPTAFGAWVADPSRPVVAFEGDASTLMAVHEFDTLARYRPRMLIFVMNDAGLGAEIQKLRASGRDPRAAMLPTPDFAELAESFGLTGARLDSLEQAEGIVAAFASGEGTHVVDVPISRQVIDRHLRSAFFSGPTYSENDPRLDAPATLSDAVV